ncbi:hypothetical protein E2G82_23060 [Salmonella enterica subsp. enterica serovar Ramatgan]|nr:hypothetical protein [Salmonella enterica subsp. enterica serovar Ramatgan]
MAIENMPYCRAIPVTFLSLHVSIHPVCMVVKIGGLTKFIFLLILIISQLMAKAIPVRGAKFREADVH